MRNRGSPSLMILVSLAAALAGGVMVARAGRYSEHTDGVVTRLYPCPSYKKGRSCADVSFTAQGRLQVTTVVTRTSGGLRRGERVPLVFDPDDPSAVKRDNAGEVYLVPYGLLLGGIAGAVVAFLRGNTQGWS